MKDFRIEVEYDEEGEELKIRDLNSYDNNTSYIIKSELDIISSIKDFIYNELKENK